MRRIRRPRALRRALRHLLTAENQLRRALKGLRPDAGAIGDILHDAHCDVLAKLRR